MQYHLMSDYYWAMLDQMVNFYRSLLSKGIVSAVVILAIGVVIAIELDRVTRKVIQKVGVDKSLEAVGVKSFLKRAGIRFSVSDAAGWLVKWFVILFALMASVESLGLPQVSEFLTRILDYMPNLVGALAVLTVGLIIAQMVYEAIEGGAKAAGVKLYSLVAVAVKWIIIIVTFLVVLEQIGIETTVLRIFVGGLSLMIALAGGLAFGLGGQYHAKELLDEIKNRVSRHE